MAGKKLELVNGVPRMRPEGITIYDEYLDIISGAPSNSNEMTGPVTAGSDVTLPNSGTYSSLDQLEIYLNGDRLQQIFDFVSGTNPTTQVQFTFDLQVGDRLKFRVDRNP